MKVVVLGAGVVGVTSAWYLNRAGHEVTVVERREGAGLETTFANGGQLSASHAVPWANPQAPGQMLKWLGRRGAPLAFRPTLDWRQWLWGVRFLRECTPARARSNARAILTLARASLAQLRALREETRIVYEQRLQGILSFYTDARAYERAAREAEWITAQGVPRQVKSAAECVAIEPALGGVEKRLAGGLYAPDDESGDAHVFTQRLAALCAQRGVRFLFGHRVTHLAVSGKRIARVFTQREHGEEAVFAADAGVVALASDSARLLQPLGIELPVYPVKGYSVTLPAAAGDAAPHVSLTDEEHKLVYSRLGGRLRVAGMADIGGYDADIDPRRCAEIVERVFEVFPRAGERSRAQYWAGLRPATPGNVPLIGTARYPNLFVNTGHGTLGWTLACGSAQALAQLVDGRRPDIDFPFLRSA